MFLPKLVHWIQSLHRHPGESRKCETPNPRLVEKAILPEELKTWPELRAFLAPYLGETYLEETLRNAIVDLYDKTLREVTCIEPLLTSERWTIFLRKLEQIKNVNPEATPKLTFHGTEPENIPSIIQQGFLFPDGTFHKSANGTAYGKGIYSSPDMYIASPFGAKIILCAVISSKPRRFIRSYYYPRNHQEKGCDSHVSDDERILVMLQSEQIVPLCVVHSENRYWDFKSRTERVTKRDKLTKNFWKGLSRRERFMYQQFREVKGQLPMIMEKDKEKVGSGEKKTPARRTFSNNISNSKHLEDK
jgi:hypothetical protein